MTRATLRVAWVKERVANLLRKNERVKKFEAIVKSHSSMCANLQFIEVSMLPVCAILFRTPNIMIDDKKKTRCGNLA